MSHCGKSAPFGRSFPWWCACPCCIGSSGRWFHSDAYHRPQSFWPQPQYYAFGDLVWYLVWLNFKAVGLDYKRFVDYWDWWTYWLPVVVVVGNLFLARRWWQMFRPAKSPEAVASAILADVEPGFQPGGKNRTSENVSVELERHGQAGELSGRQVAALYSRPGGLSLLFKHALRGAALFLAWCAVVLTAIHLVLPRMTVNDFTLSMADAFLVRDEWRKDFDFVVRSSVSRGKRLGAILEHASLAHLQRHHFYENLDESVYQQFVLSPDVDRTAVVRVGLAADAVGKLLSARAAASTIRRWPPKPSCVFCANGWGLIPLIPIA